MAGPGRTKQHTLAVRRPAGSLVITGVISQPAGDAALRRDHVDVGVAVITTRERHPLSIRGEPRVCLHPDPGGQGNGPASLTGNAPQVPAIGKDDVGVAQRRLLKQGGRIGGAGGRRQPQQADDKGEQSLLHGGSPG